MADKYYNVIDVCLSSVSSCKVVALDAKRAFVIASGHYSGSQYQALAAAFKIEGAEINHGNSVKLSCVQDSLSATVLSSGKVLVSFGYYYKGTSSITYNTGVLVFMIDGLKITTGASFHLHNGNEKTTHTAVVALTPEEALLSYSDSSADHYIALLNIDGTTITSLNAYSAGEGTLATLVRLTDSRALLL